MHSLTRKSKILSVCLILFGATFFYYDGSGRLAEKITFLVPPPKTNLTISPVKIVIWTCPMKPPAKSRLDRLHSFADDMNKNQNSFCSILKQGDNEPCEFSSNPDDINDADVVVFFMFTDGYKLSEIPNTTKRRPEQLWVMYIREPPIYLAWSHPLPNLFNWTMSYRKDSDIWTPYGKKLSRSLESAPLFLGNYTLQEWISGKTKLVTGVISRCHSESKREILIKQMKNASIEMDIYGGCGNKKICGRYAKNCSSFWEDTARRYKFYLAFENSLCKDYITEKFWRSLELGMVPVVFGGGNYYLEAPPHSYIDIRNFTSAENLGKYLKMLDENNEEYAKYFEWRKDYSTDANSEHDGCILCKAVQNFKKNGWAEENFYSNPKWWYDHQPNSNEAACHKNRNLEFFTKI